MKQATPNTEVGKPSLGLVSLGLVFPEQKEKKQYPLQERQNLKSIKEKKVNRRVIKEKF